MFIDSWRVKGKLGKAGVVQEGPQSLKFKQKRGGLEEGRERVGAPAVEERVFEEPSKKSCARSHHGGLKNVFAHP